MDYTTTAILKQALHIAASTDDSLLGRCVTNASRFVDRFCSKSVTGSDNYFMKENVVAQVIRAKVDIMHRIACWPRKSQINSVSAMSYRVTPTGTWQTVDVTKVTIDGATVHGWASVDRYSGLEVMVSFNGGHGDVVTSGSGSQVALPDDLVEFTTVCAARFYREYETGLTDAIGIAELGTLTFTKALPARVVEMMRPYMRVVPW